ncbi:hypothetical protein FPV67DRAFT_1672312 [Lyophyllum atratum]|nr:hypothetical protein FPV67DRAFT_1672312 [Lyophyllum atratum]
MDGHNNFTNVGGDGNIVNLHSVHMAQDNEGKDQKILTWLGAPDPSHNYHDAREKHCDDTGTWFLNGEEDWHPADIKPG